MLKRIPAVALLCVATLCGAAAAQTPSSKPTLVVLIAIDQFRGDYLQRFAPQLTGGLGRLSRGGAWFTNAHHDHAITETAPGHASLLSGRFPRSTGIMKNSIGVEDPDSPLIAGGIGTGASPRRFTGTELFDWIAAADSRSRAFSVSSKDRAAILPIGRSKSDVYWYSPDGRFITSRYYRDTLPTWVNAFNDRHMPQAFAGSSWNLLLPASAYTEADSVPIEGNGVDFMFPHMISDDPTIAAGNLRGTPFIDNVTLAFALHGLRSLNIGRGPQTDVMSISLSGTDYIGHRYGSDSREIHDQILRVDRQIGAFLDSLYKLRDSSSIVIALSGDHGAGSMPEFAPASTSPKPTRGVSLAPAMASLRARLRALKVDTTAVELDGPAVAVNRAAFEKAHVNTDSLLDLLQADLRRIPGVARADRFQKLLADTASDPIARRWSHQFPATSNVEVVVTMTPYSLYRGAIATHGSPYDYDSNVPIVFYGAGIVPGKHAEFVRTVDIGATLAALLGVKPLERLDGVPLKSAIR